MAFSRRTALLAFAWLLTAAAVGILAAWLLRPAAEVRYLSAGGAREVALTPSIGTPTRASEPPRPAEVPGATRPTEPRVVAAPVGPSAGVAASDSVALLVTVLRADGSPAERGSIYALGAGEPGADEAEEVCHGEYEYGERGAVRLLLPRPGVYDVGYRSDLHAFAADVRVGPGETVPLTLRIPGDRPVRAEITGTWPPEGAPACVARVHLGPVDGRGRRNFPGRGERPRLGASLAILIDQTAGETAPLPANETWRMVTEISEPLPRGHGETEEERAALEWVTSFRHELVPDREAVRTGETVRLRVRSWPVVRFRADGTGLDPANRDLVLEFHAGGVSQRREVSLLGGEKDRGREHWFWFRADGREYRLRWSGRGVAANEATGVLPAPGRFADVDIVLQPDPQGTADPSTGAVAVEAPKPPVLERFEIMPDGLPAGGEPSCVAVGLVTQDDGRVAARADACDQTGSDGSPGFSLGGDWRRALALRFVSGTDRASDSLTPPPSGPLRVVLRPAGLLCVVPDRFLAEGFGPLTVRLADGSPLPVHGTDPQAAMNPGTLLGPLPEGTYTFKARLGSVPLPDATATVKAGGVEVLRISTR